MPRAPRSVHLDELEAIPGPGTLTWHPVRAHLGLRAFGANAYTAATHRHAVAAEPGTTVLSFGGPPTFTPSAWEWSFRAEPHVEADPQRAREIVEDGLRAHPDSPSLLICLARLEVRAGRQDAARDLVRRALARQPEAEELAREDPRLAALLA
jgi:hypothetical protein